MNKEYDVIVVGTGTAGLYAALQFESAVRVLLISKRELPLSNSSLAQGGVAAVLDLEHDDYTLHFEDTMVAGGRRNDPKAVEVLVKEGPDNVRAINAMGVDFDKEQDGSLQKTLEAGHSRRRIVHHKDSTGKAIVDALIEQVRERDNIQIAENTLLFSLERAENGFFAGIMDANGEAQMVGCRFCILATGGIGRVYQYTTNSAISTGDGITLAHKLGARIRHLSWVQFHPTAFAAEPDRERFLISEAVRGEGAVLLNGDGQRFAHHYDSRGELAPRDVVSRAIVQESIKKGNEHFYLDITHKDPEFVKNRFPMIYQRCLEEGVDITVDRIPVFPCQHYLMGGIQVDLRSATTVDRLYAAGECSHTGVHGANRLASNSLLEALVFSRRAARDIQRRLKEEGERSIGRAPALPRLTGAALPHGLRTEIRAIIQDAHFVIPKPEKVPEGLRRLEEIRSQLETGEYAVCSDYVEAHSLATVAALILEEVSGKREG
ncbi:MAG: L-aspartate oxidase [Clostridiales bacterium]|jgi:L-aspartate oxidase|nr:L-aspartate oxidase [Clostridiales bacterium]